MLHPLRTRRIVDPNLVDTDYMRPSLAHLNGQRVLVTGPAAFPELGGAKGPFPGGPRYTIGVARNNDPNRAAVVQPFDPTGQLLPSEVGPAVAVDHVTAYQHPFYGPNRDPAEYRTASGPVVGAGHIHDDSNGRYHFRESPHPVASSLYNEALAYISQLPPEQQLGSLKNVFLEFKARNEAQAIAWDLRKADISNALANLKQAVQDGADLTTIMNTMRLPEFNPIVT
jgi:hypothetical protein